MRGKMPSAALVWALAGTLCLSLFPLIERSEKNLFERTEPYFCNPVLSPKAPIVVRSDAYGKGYFGATRGNNGKRRHQGLDILAAVGEPVLAAKSGRVTFTGWDRGYGHWMEIAHPDGLVSRYAHLSEVGRQAGDWVKKGEVIGKSGKTGNARNPLIHSHLHFEIRYQSRPTDPLKHLIDPVIPVTRQA